MCSQRQQPIYNCVDSRCQKISTPSRADFSRSSWIRLQQHEQWRSRLMLWHEVDRHCTPTSVDSRGIFSVSMQCTLRCSVVRCSGQSFDGVRATLSFDRTQQHVEMGHTVSFKSWRGCVVTLFLPSISRSPAIQRSRQRWADGLTPMGGGLQRDISAVKYD